MDSCIFVCCFFFVFPLFMVFHRSNRILPTVLEDPERAFSKGNRKL